MSDLKVIKEDISKLYEELWYYKYNRSSKYGVAKFDNGTYISDVDVCKRMGVLKGKIAKIEHQQKEDLNTCLKHIMNHFDKKDLENDIDKLVSSIKKEDK